MELEEPKNITRAAQVFLVSSQGGGPLSANERTVGTIFHQPLMCGTSCIFYLAPAATFCQCRTRFFYQF